MTSTRPAPGAPRTVPALLAGALLTLALPVAAPGGAPRAEAAVAAAASPSEAATAAREMVVRTSDAVLAIIRDDALSYSQKRERMERLLADNVDLDYMSRLVMARNWSQFSAEQQAAFIREFQTHLVLTYFNNIANAKIDHIEIEDVREEERYGHVIVNTKVVVPSGGLPVYIEYRVHQPEGGGALKIIDLSVEEIKLVSNFRSQFKEVFSNGGPDHLLKLLREKNAALAEREAERDKLEAAKG